MGDDVTKQVDSRLLDDVPLVAVQGRNYLALPRDPQPWVIEKVIPVGGLVNIMGKPKLGKSYMGLGLACAVSDPKQTEWLGYKVVKHGPVVYIQIDTPRSFWADRLDSITQHGYDIDNIHFVDSLLAPYPFNVMEQKVIDQIKDLVVKTKPVLLIFDTLREIHEYDENDSTAMKKVLTNVVYSVRGTNTTVVFISHTRKEQNIFKGGGKPQDDLMNDGRGTSYIPGRMDVMMKLTEKQLLMKGRGLVATTLRIEQDKNCGMIVLDREREERKQHIKAVLAIPGLTKAEQAKMLADMDGISLAAAKARLHRHKENGGDEDDDGD